MSAINRLEEAGVDELVFTCTTADDILDAVDRLAEVLASRSANPA